MHIPVLYQEVIDFLEPRNGSRFIDATAGAGGHTIGLLRESAPDGIVMAMDRDPEAISIASQKLSEFNDRVVLVNASYERMAIEASVHGLTGVDGVLMDLGLSSMQLAESERGFSFREDGPLDMRFDARSGSTAADIVNSASREDLDAILRQYGEVRNRRRIVNAVIDSRPIDSTGQLAELIVRVSGRRGRIHPATQVFQALRIAVNDELEVLSKGLNAAVEVLKLGGRLAVISFHSLEDRMVKQFIRDQSQECECPPEFPVCICDSRPVLKAMHRKIIRPSEEEVRTNPRSRSARMRVAEKVGEVKA